MTPLSRPDLRNSRNSRGDGPRGADAWPGKVDLIRGAGLGAELAGDLHPWVRDKFRELWQAAQAEDPYE